MAGLSSSIYNLIMSACMTRQYERENRHVYIFSKSLRAYMADRVHPISSDCFKRAINLTIYYIMNILIDRY